MGVEAVPRDVIVGDGGQRTEEIDHGGHHVLGCAETVAESVHGLARGQVIEVH
jgi:hypothetical protein